MIVLPGDCAVIFDLDDTLYAERSFQLSGFSEIAHVVATENSHKLLDGMLDEARRRGDPLALAARQGALNKADLLGIYRTHTPRIRLYSDARRFLCRVAAQGVPMALVTDGRSITQRNKLRALGILDIFEEVIISEEVGVGKPHPAVFHAASQGFAGRPLVYIGDNPAKDFVTPNSLGWQTVMLADRGDNVHPQVMPESADYYPRHRVTSFDEIGLDGA